jgi:hypothetical protein
MGVFEDHAFGRHAVQTAGVNFRFRIQATQIAVAHVVGENIYNVGRWIHEKGGCHFFIRQWHSPPET